jgi:hypothetical protein
MLYVPQESPPIARKGARKNERFDESSRAWWGLPSQGKDLWSSNHFQSSGLCTN